MTIAVEWEVKDKIKWSACISAKLTVSGLCHQQNLNIHILCRYEEVLPEENPAWKKFCRQKSHGEYVISLYSLNGHIDLTSNQFRSTFWI